MIIISTNHEIHHSSSVDIALEVPKRSLLWTFEEHGKLTMATVSTQTLIRNLAVNFKKVQQELNMHLGRSQLYCLPYTSVFRSDPLLAKSQQNVEGAEQPGMAYTSMHVAVACLLNR